MTVQLFIGDRYIVSLATSKGIHSDQEKRVWPHCPKKNKINSRL